jgi:hypothetical protein
MIEYKKKTSNTISRVEMDKKIELMFYMKKLKMHCLNWMWASLWFWYKQNF